MVAPGTHTQRLPYLFSRRRVFAFVLCAAATALLAFSAGAAHAAAVQPTIGPAHSGHAQARRHGRRVGGPVRRAWPAVGRAPRTRQARWLARQVGTIRPRSCARQWRQARRRCHLGASSAAVASTVALPLQLVRSYAIPADDPSYNRLLNWSWTYDSAVAAAAFAATADKANSGQLLDQLAALQHTGGSIEIAFDTDTGENAPVFRSGTVAWVGLAAATYDQAFGSSRYLDTEQRAADYLLSLQTASGLIKGGTDVTWVSTQHNLIAYVFLVRLGNELDAAGSSTAGARYLAAAKTIATQINTNLLVVDDAGAHFRQGLNDDTRALDVQAFGAMYLQGTGQPALATQVLAYAQKFALSDRSVTTSKDPATYNMSYSSPGPFSGYAPYVGDGAPDVRWAEGSGEMRLAQAALGQDTRALDESIATWALINKGAGSLQADRTVNSESYGVEYHVWPASTAAAWTVLSQSAPAFFVAPLRAATSLITTWTKVRGGNLITTYTDGRVNMTTSGGERRVLADAGTSDSDYTVTSNATLLSGAGYGVYVRARVDTATKLTAYAVQVDHVYGQIVVRQIQSDSELTAPIAHAPVPSGFTWYGVPHVLGVTVRGNTMNVTLDGAQEINVPDLAAASATAVKSSYGVTVTVTPPAAGGYGLRAWSDGLVSLQQMTVGPAA
jgi:hypothetical protein